MQWTKVVLFLIPFVWSVLCVPWVNRVEPFVLGLPFLMFWELAGVILTFICLACLYHLDTRHEHD